MNIENCELYVDDDKMQSAVETYGIIKNQMDSISSMISQLGSVISTSDAWKKNGKEECVAFLDLMTSYSNYISGVAYTVKTVISHSALAGKSLTGGEDHLDAIKEALDDFIEDSAKYERGGTAKGAVTLNSIQGD